VKLLLTVPNHFYFSNLRDRERERERTVANHFASIISYLNLEEKALLLAFCHLVEIATFFKIFFSLPDHMHNSYSKILSLV
jgi:hypothetical protein